MEEAIDIQYIDRVKHIHSQHRTSDDALAYAKTIDGPAETIAVVMGNDETTVTVSTDEAIYHFTAFRSDYVGHSSRTLVHLLEHFRVRLPIEYVTSHQTFDIYLSGQKIVAAETEYPIAMRSGVFELVEPIEWLMSSAILDAIIELAHRYDVTPVEISESAVGAFYSLLNLAEEYQVTPDEVIATLTSLIQNKNRPNEPNTGNISGDLDAAEQRETVPVESTNA